MQAGNESCEWVLFSPAEYCTGHRGSDVSSQHRAVFAQLFLCLYQRQQASIQAVKVVSALKFNSVLYSTFKASPYWGYFPAGSTLYPTRSSCTSFDIPRIEIVFTIVITLSISSEAVSTGCPKRNYLSATDSGRYSKWLCWGHVTTTCSSFRHLHPSRIRGLVMPRTQFSSFLTAFRNQ